MLMNRLKELRDYKKLSQQEIAKIINVSQRAYASYELGQTQPTAQSLSLLADYYHTTIDDLVGRQPETLVNLNLESDELRKIVENSKRLNKDYQLKVEAFTEFCLQEQKEKEQKNKK